MTAEEKPATTIFVSYRRDDSEATAGRLYDFLDADGRFAVLFDVASIEAGTDYREAVTEQIESAQVVLAVIGREWLTVRDRNGARRLDDPNDPVRLEVETAIAAGRLLIPVFVDGAAVPFEGDLPESIRALVRRSGLELRHEAFRDDARRLADAVGRSIERTGSLEAEGPGRSLRSRFNLARKVASAQSQSRLLSLRVPARLWRVVRHPRLSQVLTILPSCLIEGVGLSRASAPSVGSRSLAVG